MAACLFAATTLAAMPQAQNNEQRQSSRWAVLIGVNDYAELNDLEFCVSDQQALKEQLDAAGFPEDQVFLMHDKVADNKYRPFKPNIERQLQLVLGLAERDDFVLVAFSGHGVHLDGESYLCPIEARLAEPKSTMVSLEAAYQRLSKCRASFKLFLVDACRNDPRPAGQRSAETDRSNIDFATSLEKVPQGTLLWTSCTPGQISMEEKKFGRGVFMHYLIEGLRGDADDKLGDCDGKVSLNELYRYAQRETKVYVAKTFNDFQTPELYGKITDLDFVLADRAKMDLSRPKPLTNEKLITNSVGMKLALIPAGEFLMGGTEPLSELERVFQVKIKDEYRHYCDAEIPQHRVRITKPFYMSIHEVTLGDFRRFVQETGYKTEAEKDGQGGWGYNSSARKFEGRKTQFHWQNTGWSQTDEHPVVNVTWNDAKEFCQWLTRKERRTYRLPTEAEWEYACRAGRTTRFWSGNDGATLQGVANIPDASLKAKVSENWVFQTWNDGYPFTAPVGRLKANAFGLYDMHGNVWEWCEDWYADDYYQNSPPDDPKGPSAGSSRVLRGGGFGNSPVCCRSSYRFGGTPDDRDFVIGFRVVCVGGVGISAE